MFTRQKARDAAETTVAAECCESSQEGSGLRLGVESKVELEHAATTSGQNRHSGGCPGLGRLLTFGTSSVGAETGLSTYGKRSTMRKRHKLGDGMDGAMCGQEDQGT